MRHGPIRLAACLMAVLSTSALGQPMGELRAEIQNLHDGMIFTGLESSTEVRGMASVFGGLKHLDMFLVLDESESLKRTDPAGYRARGAAEMVRELPPKSDIQIGVVGFGSQARLVAPLTKDRQAIVESLSGLQRAGLTDIAGGIYIALEQFAKHARPDSSQVILLFTDGESNRNATLAAATRARKEGVAVHALFLGRAGDEGATLASDVANLTGASFVHVTAPEKLPEEFRNLRTTGVDHVTVSSNGSPPIPASLVGGEFAGHVPLRPGHNTITATATSVEGEVYSDLVKVEVLGPLNVTVEQPPDGTVLNRIVGEAQIEIAASVFPEMTDALRADFPTHGVDRVTLRVNDGPEAVARFGEGRFVAPAALRVGVNRIVAQATSIDGRTGQVASTVEMRPTGCAALSVRAERDGRPALSLSDRGIELIFDASNSMWGRIGGKPKIEIAKNTVIDVVSELPADLILALRVYGHRYPADAYECEDSELLVALERDNRGEILEAVRGFQPKGRTPLAYSIGQSGPDFADFRGSRAVVLVTDGIESCKGDPVQAARDLQQAGKSRPVHVIGFALGDAEAEQNLRGIADASGGQYFTADNADELRRALTATAGTPFALWRGEVEVARGALGVIQSFKVPAGSYELRLDSEPPLSFPVRLAPEEGLDLVLSRTAGDVSTREDRAPVDYMPCDEVEPVAGMPSSGTPTATPMPGTPAPTTMPSPPGTSLANRDVIEMTRAGLTPSIIIAAIDGAARTDFDVSVAGLIELSKAGVDQQVIKHMQQVASGAR